MSLLHVEHLFEEPVSLGYQKAKEKHFLVGFVASCLQFLSLPGSPCFCDCLKALREGTHVESICTMMGQSELILRRGFNATWHAPRSHLFVAGIGIVSGRSGSLFFFV